MKPKAYIETSMVSYLTALPSRDLVRAAHQQVTREWWAGRGAFELYISEFVVDEAAKGDTEAAGLRLSALKDIVLLDVNAEARGLAARLIADGGLPGKVRVDAAHVALATVHGMDYLLTWNCTHIANAALRARIEAICRGEGFQPPILCTPLELAKE